MDNITTFSVFAGANGSGKSNFFDALRFVSEALSEGVQSAVAQQGGYHQFRPATSYNGIAPNFLFHIECELDQTHYVYTLTLQNLDKTAGISEQLTINRKSSLSRVWGEKPRINDQEQSLSSNHSALLLYDQLPFRDFLLNLRLYRIQPLQAAQASYEGQNDVMLETSGRNIASVLKRLQKDEEIREEILDWMESMVPGLNKVITKQRHLNNSVNITFKEEGTQYQFPAHMVSSGTLALLCLLVAILDPPKPYGLVLFEEPEDGLHPKAIQEALELLREQAYEHVPIWITTHSEAIVRQLHLNEFWLVDKERGKTTMKHASDGQLTDKDVEPLGLDELWLSNLFNGGVPC